MKVAFMGNPEFALPSIQKITKSKHEIKAIISNPPTPMGRKKVLNYTAVGNYSLSNNIELIDYASSAYPGIVNSLIKPCVVNILEGFFIPLGIINTPIYPEPVTAPMSTCSLDKNPE